MRLQKSKANRILSLVLSFVMLLSMLPASTLIVSAEETVLSGWQTIDGSTYYYVNGTPVTGWQEVDGSLYYFDKTTGVLQETSGNESTDDGWDNGSTDDGWDNGSTDDDWYSGSTDDGGSWLLIDGKWYYFEGGATSGNIGQLAHDIWIQPTQGTWIYVNEDGEESATHTHTLVQVYNESNHWQECADEDCPDPDKGKTEETAHNWVDGVCTYGCNSTHAHEESDWENKDGKCSTCGLTCNHEAYSNGICTCGTGFQPCEGEGTESNPYLIANAGNLYWFAEKVKDDNTAINGKMTENIDLKDKSWTPIGTSDSNKYVGTFDGQGYTVSGLYFNDAEAGKVGLFGVVGVGGKVLNVGVIDPYLQGENNVGGVVGENYGTVSNCYNSGIGGTVIGRSCVGGVVGANGIGGTVTGCYNTGSVSGDSSVGGVVGENIDGTVAGCYYLADNETDELDGTTYKTEAQFASGEVTWLLNGESADGVWKQTLGENGDATPNFTGAAVYFDGADTYYNDVVEVVIVWTAMEFTYTTENVWNPETLKYESNGSWVPVEGGGTVTVKNDSSPNHVFTVNPVFTSTEAGVSGSFDYSNVNLPAGEEITITLTLIGKPEGEEFTDKPLGTVTIEIKETTQTE